MLTSIHDIDKFDANTTLIGVQFGVGAVAQTIQDVEFAKMKKIFPKFNLTKKQMPSHVFTSYIKNGKRYITESHLRNKGVKTFLFEDWLKGENPDLNFVFPCPLDVGVLEYYTKYNPGYSLGEIGELAASKFCGKGLHVDFGGQICSELDARAIVGVQSCFKFNIEFQENMPVHIMLMDDDTMQQATNLRSIYEII